MTNYKSGDIILIEYPFSEQTTKKKRPALVLLDSGDEDIVVSRITTKLYSTKYDIEIYDWKDSGLLSKSVIRLHKIATIGKIHVEMKLGSLSKSDFNNIKEKFRSIYQ